MQKQKISSFFILLVLFSFLALPFVCQATVVGIIDTIWHWLQVIGYSLCALMIVWGGITIIIGNGSPDKVATGRMVIMWAVIGVVVVAAASVIKDLAVSWGGGV